MRFRARLIVCGRVFTGLGEGAKYVKLYSKALRELLSCDPYPGTLNIALYPPYTKVLHDLFRRFSVLIEPPRSGLGIVRALRCRILGVPCLALFPERSVYGLSAVEVVSCVKLRDYLSLEDGECVCVEIER